MAKFVLKCPKCNTVNKASTFILAKKVIECGSCGEKINVKENRYTSKICPFCGDTFVYDQAKGQQSKCLSCNKSLDAFHEKSMVVINCPQCACGIEVGENLKTKDCPICGMTLDVQKEIEKAKMVTNTQISVIQYEGDNSTFVWKHPIEDFNIGSQLIVHESQEAIFFLNGEALDTFGPGRHTLETENIPFLKNIYKLPVGSQSPFHAEVYFINKVVSFGIKWGTASRVRFVDPLTNIPIEIGASGEMNLQVSDGRKLLTKMVGTTGSLDCKDALRAEGAGHAANVHKALQEYFRAPLMTELKSHLARTIKENGYDILDMDMYLSELSEAVRERILPKFEEYGVTVPNFYIEHILIPDQDHPNVIQLMKLRSEASLQALEAQKLRAQRETLMEEQTNLDIAAQRAADRKAYEERAQGFAEAEVMRAKGYDHKDELQAEVQKAYAAGIGQMGSGGSGGSGEGGGSSMVGDLMGAMVGMKVAGSMLGQLDFGGLNGENSAAQTPAAQTPAADTWTCECGETGNTKNFCMNCGKPKPSAWTCPECGEAGNTKNFCMNCGKPKPSAWKCPECGEEGNTKNFCMNCGAKKPE